jgi:hypothetical protein
VGHTGNGKAYDDYQSFGALLALNGMVGLVFDAIDESERLQYRGERGSYNFDKWGAYLHGTYGHQMIGIGSILLGRNTARVEICDTMRAIDYLQSRPEVDRQRIGCTGHSGRHDHRLRGRAGRPRASLGSELLRQRLSSCVGAPGRRVRNWAACLRPADPVDDAGASPILFCGAPDYFDMVGTWSTFRYAKRLFVRLGFGERMEILENDAHNYNHTQRENRAVDVAVAAAGPGDHRTGDQLLNAKEAQCTPDGQVMQLRGTLGV